MNLSEMNSKKSNCILKESSFEIKNSYLKGPILCPYANSNLNEPEFTY